MSEEKIWKALENVYDPEIPKLSLIDLGVVTDVIVESNDTATVTITPTFAGCPAIHYMQDAIKDSLREIGISKPEVRVSFEKPWNSNKISEKGRAILKESGFAPPPKHEGYIELSVLETVTCPFCGSTQTTLQTPFGPTLCRSIHYCNSCLQAFEQFKPLA
ncbi:MAG: phenylacetate-CoA oxygenase subunit PaaJ [Candidatus Kapabacteria bacterium]|nr:phenylacetate-CoA oxygenase subunit PaaJ [Candidatus Kapabacteria bacterium]